MNLEYDVQEIIETTDIPEAQEILEQEPPKLDHPPVEEQEPPRLDNPMDNLEEESDLPVLGESSTMLNKRRALERSENKIEAENRLEDLKEQEEKEERAREEYREKLYGDK